ncbi:MAG: ABC-F family ATP-binding cassette domain-containing protein [Bacilli bacterium]
MLSVVNLGVTFNKQKLFDDANLQFSEGNCYGVIGANGSGKSTFLRVLAGQIESTSGAVVYDKNLKLSFLEQDHHKYNNETIINVVLMGHKQLYSLIEERNILYGKTDFSEEDGLRSAEIEADFLELNGWEAESEAEIILNGLNLDNKDYYKQMNEVSDIDKVKILLAQALFGDPDILLLDEPTNHLDFYAIKWLENFLINFKKTLVVVSHDRHFLNTVCTHIVDIDFNEIKLFPGNYDFWKQSSELVKTMQLEQNKKKEQQIKELESFVARFSANASKSKQATSRKKILDKINLEEIKPSSRKYPYIIFNPKRRLGNQILSVDNMTYTYKEQVLFKDLTLSIGREDKVVVISNNDNAVDAFFEIITGNITDGYDGEFNWGNTVEYDYLPKDNGRYFNDNNLSLIDWLSDFSEEKGEGYLRSFLGKMLFSREEPLKKVKVLSGGEKMRMMFSKIMLTSANTLLLNQPTNHLDLESISSVNESLIKFDGALIYASHDLSLVETIANKIIILTDNGCVQYQGTYEEFCNSKIMQNKMEELGHLL